MMRRNSIPESMVDSDFKGKKYPPSWHAFRNTFGIVKFGTLGRFSIISQPYDDEEDALNQEGGEGQGIVQFKNGSYVILYRWFHNEWRRLPNSKYL